MWLPRLGLRKISKKRDPSKEKERNKRHSISVPYLSGVCEKFRRILQKHNFPFQLEPSNTRRQKLVQPKDKTSRDKRSNVVSAVQREESQGTLHGGN